MNGEWGTIEDLYYGPSTRNGNDEGDDAVGRGSEDEVSGTSTYPSSLSSTDANLSGTTLVGQDSCGQTPIQYDDSRSSSSDPGGGGVEGPLIGRHYRPAEFDFGLDGDDGDDEDEE